MLKLQIKYSNHTADKMISNGFEVCSFCTAPGNCLSVELPACLLAWAAFAQADTQAAAL